MKTHHKYGSVFLALGLIPGLLMAEPEKLWSLSGFDKPESVLMDTEAKRLYVSNIEGSPMGVDGKGSVSIVSLDGQMIDRTWTEGLDAPKGMAIRGGYLLVADMKNLRVIDRKMGEVVDSYHVANAGMLNDVTVDDQGQVYVSDLINGGVYRLEEDKLTLWISPEEMPHPNGLFYLNGKLLLASWGKGMHDDFSTDVPGSLYQVDPETKVISVYSGGAKMGNLDGIGMNGDQVVVNDWITGEVFSVANGKSSLLLSAGKSAADISVHNGVLYVPVMFEQRVDAYSLKP